jgi:RNase adaptor protein for sRNA GlmZ degradation
MKRILITGMSGTGKSSVLEELKSRGYITVDADTDEWSEWKNVVFVDGDTPQPDWVWREDKIRILLQQEYPTNLFVSGCTPNQGKFYSEFDRVVLFTAPLDVMLHRVATRQTNPYGKSDEERNQIIHNTEVVEPLLRSGCDLEIDTSKLDIQQVADKLIVLAEERKEKS